MPDEVICGVAALWRRPSLAVALAGTLGLAHAVTWRIEAAAREPIAVAKPSRTSPVSFEAEILPLLRDNCQACHNSTKPKAGLALETPATLLKGGESGPSVVPGKGAESLLLKVAAHQEDPIMPPPENKVGAKAFTSEQLGLLQLWIDQGATGQVSSAKPPLKWQPLPATFVAINATALTEDGRFAACGRGNQIDLYDLALGVSLGRLTRPDEAMHRDVVQSLAFDATGTKLASGGYRSIKLWHREPLARGAAWALPAEARVAAASPDRQIVAIGFADRSIELWKASGEKWREIAGSTGLITALAFSPDGAALAGLKDGKVLEIWSSAEWNSIFKVDTEARGLAWLPGGKQVATGTTNGAIRIWDVAATNSASAPARELAGHTGAITSLATHPTKALLLSASADGSVRVWDLEKGEAIRQLDHGAPVMTVAFRPDGKRILSLGEGSVAKLWDAESGSLVAELKGNRNLMDALARADRTLAFSKSEIGYHNSTVDAAQKQQATDAEALKKANDGKAAADAEFAAKETVAKQVTQARDQAKRQLEAADRGVQLATQNKDAAAKLADLAGQQLKAARETATQAVFVLETIQPAKDAAYQRLLETAAEAKAAADNPEKRAAAERASEDFVKAKGNLEAAVSARDASAQVVKDLEVLGPQNGEAKAATEKALADATARQKESGEANQKAEKDLAEADKNLQKARADQAKAHDNAQFAAKIAQKSEEALSTARAGLLSANEVLKLAEAERSAAAKTEEEKRPKFVSAAFSPDGQSIVTIANGGGMQIWNADSGQAVEAVAADAAQDVMFVGATRVLVIGSKTAPWDITPVWKFERAIGREDDGSPIVDRVLALAFSADAKLLASGGGQPSHDGEIKLWNPADGSLIRAFTDPHSDTVYSLAFSPDQKRLASGGADKFAKVFEVDTGRLIKSFEGHTHHVLGVSWKRDGRTLASAGADKVIKVWNTVTGEQRKTVDGFGKEITSVQFLDASAEALVSTGDSQLRLIRDDGNNNVRSFEGATGFLTSAAVTPDGKRVVAANQEGVLRVWDGATGKLVRTFEPPREEKLASRAP